MKMLGYSLFGRKSKKAQEEMIGFALIIVIVAVIGLVFLWFSTIDSGEENLDNAEIQNFLNSYNQFTTSCSDTVSGRYKIRDLVLECDPGSEEEICGGMTACEKLENSSRKILNESWQVGPNRPDKGYELVISSREEGSDASYEQIVNVTEGNTSLSTYRGGSRSYSRDQKEYDIVFRVYS